MHLKDKVALVTGGAVRVGREIALALAHEGVHIGLHYSRSEGPAQETARELKAIGSRVLPLQGDFSEIKQIGRVVNSCHEYFGRIDILINNAAVYFATPFGATTEKQWDRLMSINLRAPFFCSQYAASIMKENKQGKIISIADVAGLIPWPDFIAYSCSKAGLIAITRGMARALAPEIQVNAIASGTVLLQPDAKQKHIESVKNQSLLKKIGSPADIVNTVLYLLKGSDFVTGEVIAVDGGRHLS